MVMIENYVASKNVTPEWITSERFEYTDDFYDRQKGLTGIRKFFAEIFNK